MCLNSKELKRNIIIRIFRASLDKAVREQHLDSIKNRLQAIVPDISEQYSTFTISDEYMRNKVRNLHAFQISLVTQVLEGFEKATVVDIGDSSGTHLQYLLGLYAPKKKIECFSINLDEKAVEKIRRRGLNAIHARAEEMASYNLSPDILLCFEMLEHLGDPARFLHTLSSRTEARFLIITVPYLRKSRVGLHHIRQNRSEKVTAENTHILELCPEDWKILIRHSGWEIIKEEIYFQYPRRDILCVSKLLWRRFDFEGFYGMILKRDDKWASLYADWPLS